MAELAISRRVAAAVLTVALVVATAAAVAAATSGRAAAPKAVKVVSCAAKAEVRPSSFVITCADANEYLKAITWKTWGKTTATASATYVANNCTPYCAAGKFIDYPATVTLSAPKSSKYGSVFTKLHVAYRDAKKTKSFDFTLLS